MSPQADTRLTQDTNPNLKLTSTPAAPEETGQTPGDLGVQFAPIAYVSGTLNDIRDLMTQLQNYQYTQLLQASNLISITGQASAKLQENITEQQASQTNTQAWESIVAGAGTGFQAAGTFIGARSADKQATDAENRQTLHQGIADEASKPVDTQARLSATQNIDPNKRDAVNQHIQDLREGKVSVSPDDKSKSGYTDKDVLKLAKDGDRTAISKRHQTEADNAGRDKDKANSLKNLYIQYGQMFSQFVSSGSQATGKMFEQKILNDQAKAQSAKAQSDTTSQLGNSAYQQDNTQISSAQNSYNSANQAEEAITRNNTN
ncbi:MAG: hypothetical protein MRY21_04840 [Simkaniaceae bacterium]|nr:hypothetical protein [Simkaniaceae bacterium]